MSRRQVSIKDLGVADCQGWLHRRKEGCSFLGSKWKKYWFVLKKCSLYWYADRMADKADGFINVSGFTIEQAKHCRKKHAIIATHPLVVTIFFAAESFIEMNKWITNLSEAAKQHEVINTEECYSESSDQEGDEPVSTCSQDSEQGTTESENGDVSEPLCESSSCPSIPLSMTATENRSINTSDGGTLSRNRGRRAASEGGERLSWQDVSRPDGAAPTIQLEEKEEDDIHGT
uniref:interactor protein for cytohesin exchange factors 1-like isoform X2 n=1 Tax=Monopterus albus TaxID=43700 RepID=UPI0009B37BBF|nr:interactor protein for cytohesin exchange factors 1-like isoform X2 [Monopterus albus]